MGNVMKTRIIATILCIWSLAAFAKDAAPDSTVQNAKDPLATIEALDVSRYMGTWYEIAKFPNWFQRKCIGHTKADYSIQGDGKVQVINRCRLENGEMAEAIGAARQVGAATSPKLEVRFAPAWLAFIPALWGDYWVIDLDEEYQLVAVSDPRREYLWVLSRAPKVDQKSYENLLLRLTRKGFDIRKLEVTNQD
jgi:apolipoprotein D and lipocalin family protein